MVRLALRIVSIPAKFGLWVSPPSLRPAHAHEVDQALRLEYRTFRAMGICEESPNKRIDAYDRYLDQSRFYVADWNGRIAGVLRVIENAPHLPPVREEFETFPEFVEVTEHPGFEEVGICAVHPLFVNTELGIHLYRTAWRDAKSRGVTHWGAITEGWLWRLFAKRYYFTFAQAGPESYYMGAVNYPLVMAFQDVELRMRQSDPEMFEWFTSGIPGLAE